MYLVIEIERLPNGMVREYHRGALESFVSNDAVEVSKYLKTGRYKAFTLDALKEIKEIIVSTEEKMA